LALLFCVYTAAGLFHAQTGTTDADNAWEPNILDKEY